MLRVLKPGLQTTLQGAARTGWRHWGIPYAGPADPLSMALANRLVLNAADDTALEITYGGFEVDVTAKCSIAITGAHAAVTVNNVPAPAHETLHLKTGDLIQIAPPKCGARIYLSIAGGFAAEVRFGSSSTYLPAGFGGHEGRAIQAGDTLQTNGDASISATVTTPGELRPIFTNSFALRACASAETGLLAPSSEQELFERTFTAGRQGTRMGLPLDGASLELQSDGRMKSAAVYPGTVQCPPSGQPIILSCDAQTTGGYPRVAHIACCDRHLLGQIRPGDRVRLLKRSADDTVADLASKKALFSNWLADADIWH